MRRYAQRSSDPTAAGLDIFPIRFVQNSPTEGDSGAWKLDGTVAPATEPASLLLFGANLARATWLRRRR